MHYKTLVLVSIVFLFSKTGYSQSRHESGTKVTNNTLIGSWKIQEIQYQYPDTTYTMNANDFGRVMFSKNNYSLTYYPYMMPREAFRTLSKPTNEEIVKAFRSMVFNTGSYTIDTNILTTTADLAKVPGFEGGKQFYTIEQKEFLVITMYDETYPDGTKPEWFGKLKVRFTLKKEN